MVMTEQAATEDRGQMPPASAEVAFAEAFGGDPEPQPAPAAPKPDAGPGAPPTADTPRGTPTDPPAGTAEEPAADDGPEDDRPLTRRSWAAQRRTYETKLAELERKIQSSESSKAQIEAARDEAEELTAEFLGLTPQPDGKTSYDRIREAFERGDYGADREYLRYTKNREFFGALSQKAQKAGETLATQRWVESYAEAATLPGVDKDALYKVTRPGDSLKLVHAAGAASRQAEVDERDERIAALEAELKDARAGRAARAATPLSGGRPGYGRSDFDWAAPVDRNFEAAFGDLKPSGR